MTEEVWEQRAEEERVLKDRIARLWCREVERNEALKRKNKVLKAAVEALKSELRRVAEAGPQDEA